MPVFAKEQAHALACEHNQLLWLTFHIYSVAYLNQISNHAYTAPVAR
jgi:hypothetical protein